MVKVDFSSAISAPQEKIYNLITDFEKLPARFPDTYKSLKVIDRSDNRVTVEEDIVAAGRNIHQTTRHAFEPKRFLRSEVIDGDTKGTVVEITLEPDSDPAKTKVSVKADLKFGKLGAMLGVFAKGKIKSGLQSRIQQFEQAVNSMG